MATTDMALPRCDGSNVSRMMLCWFAEKSLRQPENDQLRQAGGKPAEQAAHGEHADADQEIAFAPQQIRQPAADRQHDAVGHQVACQRPGRVVIAG
jgi:hypothetical protein